MAAASDKARFYLEQQVPELQEFERKAIFSRDEIAAITSKRSGFEHVLNARGTQAADYVRYASYEMNLDSLRKKRCKRLEVKASRYNGQKTIFFILERGTRRFPGDLRLWMQYIDYCKRQEANKKLAKAFTSVLRLHPCDWNLWILAAKHYAEQQGDMGTARSYLQRGLRFCMTEPKLYIEYMKLEMVYLAKLAARRKVLGLDEARAEKETDDENMIVLPTITAEDINPDLVKGTEEVDVRALERLSAAPALTGAIPSAIFDAAMKQVQNSLSVAEEMFNLVATFATVPATTTVLQHILEHMRGTDAVSVATAICEAQSLLFGIDPQSAEFPSALGLTLTKLRTALERLQGEARMSFAERAVSLLLTQLAVMEEQDQDLVTVLEVSIRSYVSVLMSTKSRYTITEQSPLERLIGDVQANGREADVTLLRQLFQVPVSAELE